MLGRVIIKLGLLIVDKASFKTDSGANGTRFSWRADEYIKYRHKTGWYFNYSAIVALVVALSYLITKDFIPSLALVVMAGLFLAYSLMPPKKQAYQLSRRRLMIGQRAHYLSRFSSFSLIQPTSRRPQLQLFAKQRLTLPLVVPLPPSSAEEVSRFLAEFLRYDPGRRPHPIDRLMMFFRF